jgi:hypothetical protein
MKKLVNVTFAALLIVLVVVYALIVLFGTEGSEVVLRFGADSTVRVLASMTLGTLIARLLIKKSDM